MQDDSERRSPAEDRRTPAWTRDHAAGIERSEDTVAPIIYPPEAPVDSDLHIWDTWFLRERDGSVAEIDGYRVILALTSSSELLPGKRHDVATVRYFYSRDGENWETGGPVFDVDERGPLGSRQWAGSALYDRGEDDEGTVYAYYTASGARGEEELTYTQRLAVGHGGTIEADENGLRIEGPWTHEVLLEPDGEYYETESQSRGMIYTFRDPWFFEDDGTTYLLFEANTPVPEESDACGGDAAQQEFNGSVGVAESPTGDPADFELRPPLLDAVCVNQELERPHAVRRDGRYYLFISSHDHTFAPGLDGYDALYGFVADSLRGEYEPLNGSGLVLTNPANAPFQAYSWLAYDHGDELLVTSFFNYFEFDRPSLDEVAVLPEAEQLRRFGGTLAPTVRLKLDGNRTRVVGTLGHGHLPLPDERLPEPWWERGEELPNESGYGRRT
ncbi:glycoside hydrolase family 68 protein [Haloprofundus sp. MHR1]|uniref:glycoside hydrolase family 68 protein n=1 Tax=Haloprofundus sp. MHR1 TaxID=2572921 RepID=UPI0010BEEBA3|nr:glycoside hydrolase family 68 protein [Haloprofundus sp. MHR1]QCJ45783.1 glycoside hydrolase family 68 protein [Haloprofundus sp. MHR1]